MTKPPGRRERGDGSDEFEQLLVCDNGKVRQAEPGEYVAERTMCYLLAMEAAIRKAWRLGDLRLAMDGLQTLLRLGPLGRTRIDLAAVTATLRRSSKPSPNSAWSISKPCAAAKACRNSRTVTEVEMRRLTEARRAAASRCSSATTATRLGVLSVHRGIPPIR